MTTSERERSLEDSEPTVLDPFLSFWKQLGQEVCGRPITGQIEENGVVTQYFDNVALEEFEPGQVRLKPLGREVLQFRRSVGRQRPMVLRPLIVDVVNDLSRNPERRYDTRSLADIRYLIVHHTATAPSVDVEAIARYHTETLGWPGIGYHYVIAADGTIRQTNELATVSFHARQQNRTGAGIAFSGNFGEALPTEAQLESGGALLAYLLQQLSLPIQNVRGHKAFVQTECPGTNWLEGAVWKDALYDRIQSAQVTYGP